MCRSPPRQTRPIVGFLNFLAGLRWLMDVVDSRWKRPPDLGKRRMVLVGRCWLAPIAPELFADFLRTAEVAETTHSPPEDRVAAVRDVVQQRLGVLGRALALVLVELQAPIASVDRPRAGRRRVAQPGDLEPGVAEHIAPSDEFGDETARIGHGRHSLRRATSDPARPGRCHLPQGDQPLWLPRRQRSSGHQCGTCCGGRDPSAGTGRKGRRGHQSPRHQHR
jgi:hypothetical protein